MDVSGTDRLNRLVSLCGWYESLPFNTIYHVLCYTSVKEVITLANDGFDELQDFFEKAEQGAKELQGQHEYELGEILTDSFISNHTTSSSLDSWWESGKFNTDDLDSVDPKVLDSYVQQSTQFSTFDDMLEEAGAQYAARKLGFDNWRF